MNQTPPSQRKIHKFFDKKIVYSIVAMIIVVAVVWSTATHYIIRGEARRVLREAKDVRLTIRLLKSEEYSLNKSIRDNSRGNGFSAWADDEIRDLTQHEGEYYLVYLSPENSHMMRLLYKNKGYTVDLFSDGDWLTYTVYKESRAILK